MDLKELRNLIDQIDEEILVLLNRRAGLALQVGGEKNKNNLDHYDPRREEEIYRRLEKNNTGAFPLEAVRPVYREIISACRALQEPVKVAYLGPNATFTHIAGMDKFGLSAKFLPVRTIEGVFVAVEQEQAGFGVVPVENSNEGVVTHTLDMFVDSNLKIYAEILMEISHYLLSKSGRMEDIQRLYSHYQPVAQSRSWLRDNLPDVEIIEVASTAQAAELAAEDPESAAIASESAAQMYGLKILRGHIEDNAHNLTRFLVVSKKLSPPTGKDKTSIMFSIKDRVGALHDMLTPFAAHKVNLSKIESRPSRKRAWEYIFYADMQGHQADENVKAALNDLAEQTLYLKILGSYPAGEMK